MIFWKTSEVAKEEARLAELRGLYDGGKISMAEYLNAMNQLKQTGEGAPSGGSSANVLDIVQLLLIVAIVGAAVYGIKLIKT